MKDKNEFKLLFFSSNSYVTKLKYQQKKEANPVLEWKKNKWKIKGIRKKSNKIEKKKSQGYTFQMGNKECSVCVCNFWAK